MFDRVLNTPLFTSGGGKILGNMCERFLFLGLTIKILRNTYGTFLFLWFNYYYSRFFVKNDKPSEELVGMKGLCVVEKKD